MLDSLNHIINSRSLSLEDTIQLVMRVPCEFENHGSDESNNAEV